MIDSATISPISSIEIKVSKSDLIKLLISPLNLVSSPLAVLNSLPLPLLDGGQLALLIYEAIRGKPLPKQLQLAILQSGLVFMVGLSMILIILLNILSRYFQ